MIEIIPAIDIIDGKCVRLTRGDYAARKTYSHDPVDWAKGFEAIGINRLHLVDLDGAKAGKVQNWRILAAIARQTDLNIDFGGGVRSNEDLRIVFQSGAAQVTAGSVALTGRKMVLAWLAEYGGDRIILGADSLNGRIATNAWQDANGPELPDFIGDYLKNGVKTVIATDVDRDGMMQGPAFGLYSTIKAAFPGLYLIASGGISTLDDVKKLDRLGVDGVIIGKAIYEGRITMDELKGLLC